jgi:two-component system sensor histidine kinase BaeS
MIWRNLSISYKLFAAIALTAAVIILLVAMVVTYSMREGFSRYLANVELGRFDGLVSALARSHDPQNPGWPDLVADKSKWYQFSRTHLPRPQRPDIRRQISPDNAISKLPPRPRRVDPLKLAQRLTLLDREGKHIAGSNIRGNDLIKRKIEIINTDGASELIGWVSLAIPSGRTRSLDSVFLDEQRNALVIISIAALILSAIAAWLMARHLVSPIIRIGQVASTLAAGDYSSRIKKTHNDELGTLIDNFNFMANSLEVADKAERQWVSDTSHELQTPISVLRAGIEALQDGVRRANKKNLSELHDAVMRLSQLIGDISVLSRAGERMLVRDKQIEDIFDIIKDAIESAGPGLQAAGINQRAQYNGDGLLDCDKLRMRQLIDNLLENSRRYTSSPGNLELNVDTRDNKCTILVDDSAPAPPVASFDKLFDRFYRVESSRSREFGGSGLGLAICRSIVVAHGGTINAEPSHLGGLRIIIVIPDEPGLALR